jgi:hypothetical protein
MTTTGPQFSIHFERQGYKARDLVYEEPGRRAVIPLDLSGVPQFDWVGSSHALGSWVEPAGEPIPEIERAAILMRINDWSGEQGLRIDIGPGLGEEFFDQFVQKGYTWHTEPDGSRTLRSPDRRSWLRRALDRFRGRPG